MDKAAALQKLNDEFAATCDCGLRETATLVVPGDGNAEADLLFVGEAPGKNEDLSGKPFVGAAGKFLDEMLNTAGLKREDIYITNIVKYRPPENRDPTPEEIASCEPWLHAQIELIAPQVIVTLGRHALEHFVPGKKISAVHGTAFRREIEGLGPLVFFALYHPAAALYNGSMRETLIADFRKIPELLKKLEGEGK
jgi:DNA polymerase